MKYKKKSLFCHATVSNLFCILNKRKRIRKIKFVLKKLFENNGKVCSTCEILTYLFIDMTFEIESFYNLYTYL